MPEQQSSGLGGDIVKQSAVASAVRNQLGHVRMSIRWDSEQRESHLKMLNQLTQKLEKLSAEEAHLLRFLAENGWLTEEDMESDADEKAPF